jgi:uncharacterized membrane protein
MLLAVAGREGVMSWSDYKEGRISWSEYWPMADRHVRTVRAAKASRMTGASFVPYFMLALALIGVADAFYVAQASYTGQPLREFIIEGANTVLNSPHARILGLPLSYFGLVYYLHMLALATLLAFDPFSRGLRMGAILYSAIGVASSAYFMYLQLGFIGAVCIYCLISAVTTLLLLATALRHFHSDGPRGR